MKQRKSASRLEDFDPSEIEYIGGHPMPPPPPVRPFHALRSVLRLVRNKEDTSQVFEAVSALSGSVGQESPS